MKDTQTGPNSAAAPIRLKVDGTPRQVIRTTAFAAASVIVAPGLAILIFLAMRELAKLVHLPNLLRDRSSYLLLLLSQLVLSGLLFHRLVARPLLRRVRTSTSLVDNGQSGAGRQWLHAARALQVASSMLSWITPAVLLFAVFWMDGCLSCLGARSGPQP